VQEQALVFPVLELVPVSLLVRALALPPVQVLEQVLPQALALLWFVSPVVLQGLSQDTSSPAGLQL
jgi:hypothetical protein